MNMVRVTLPMLLITTGAIALLAGCAAVDALGGTVTSQMLPLDGQYLLPLTDLQQVSTGSWALAPSTTSVAINSHRYEPGIKAAVYADDAREGICRYHLGGRFSALSVSFGIVNDEPDSPSWTAFRFWGDGREIAVPHYVKKGERRNIIVNVRGVQDFDLIAAGIPQRDGRTYGDTIVGWGDTFLLREGSVQYLADLTPDPETTWRAESSQDIWINTHPYPHSVTGMLPRDGTDWSVSAYRLGGQYRRLLSLVGLDWGGEDKQAEACFQVFGDGRPLTGTVTVPYSAERLIDVDVTGINVLQLRSRVAANVATDELRVGWGMALLLKTGSPDPQLTSRSNGRAKAVASQTIERWLTSGIKQNEVDQQYN
jgi:hypothetical protein